MTKQQFIERYGKKFFESGKLVAMKCNCGDEACSGWAAVTNNEESIKSHKDLYQ